jgi:hypothetical protein
MRKKKETNSQNEFLSLANQYQDVIESEDLRTFFTARSDNLRDFIGLNFAILISWGSLTLSTVAVIISLKPSLASYLDGILIAIFFVLFGFGSVFAFRRFRNLSTHEQLVIFEHYLKSKRAMKNSLKNNQVEKRLKI